MITGTPTPAAPWPRPSRAFAALLPAVASVVLLADQASKLWVQNHFAGQCDWTPEPLVQDWLALSYTCNHGAAFGMLANATLLFVLIAVVVVGVIVAYFRFLPANRPWLRLSLGLQLGGAVGNLVDRLRQGFVVDFIAFKGAPVFNLADSCIVIGVLILAWHLLLPRKVSPAADGQPAR